MKNEKDIGKEAKVEVRSAILASAPSNCIGGCPKCGDYMFGKDDNAVCCYCGYSELLTKWNNRT